MTRLSGADAITEIMLTVFRMNGQLLNDGDRLTKSIGLSSARWQVLGAIELAGHPVTVAQIGRRMGISRQAVQRVANDLEKEGFVTFEPNPDHARAKLASPTTKGWQALENVAALHGEWVSSLAIDLDDRKLNDALVILQSLLSQLETVDLPNHSETS